MPTDETDAVDDDAWLVCPSPTDMVAMARTVPAEVEAWSDAFREAGYVAAGLVCGPHMSGRARPPRPVEPTPVGFAAQYATGVVPTIIAEDFARDIEGPAWHVASVLVSVDHCLRECWDDVERLAIATIERGPLDAEAVGELLAGTETERLGGYWWAGR